MTSVYLDSCMIIGLIEGDATQRRVLKNRLRDQLVFSSELTRMETRLLPIRNDDKVCLRKFDRFFELCEMIPLDCAVFERATMLRARNGIQTPDALHLAAAIEGGCQEFWTNDKRLRVVAHNFLTILDWDALGAKQ